jgi:hypothetical protein
MGVTKRSFMMATLFRLLKPLQQTSPPHCGTGLFEQKLLQLQALDFEELFETVFAQFATNT